MQHWSASLFRKEEFLLGEGAHWHPRWEKFLFTDILGKKVGVLDPETGSLDIRDIAGQPGTVVPMLADTLLVALEDRLATLDMSSGILETLTAIEADQPGNRCNDGKCDPRGRFWVGTMDAGLAPHCGALYCFDGNLKVKRKGCSISNGLVWNADHTVMYYIDSLEYAVLAFDYDAQTGEISRERKVISFPDNSRAPDGMAIDQEGMLWIALWGGSCVGRFDPDSGYQLGEVSVPAPHVTSCAFGGAGLRQLLITTARSGLDADSLVKYPLSGSLFLADTGIQGVQPYVFSGKI